MQDTNKTRDQLIEELVAFRQSVVEQERANLLLSNNRVISTQQLAARIAHEINNPLGIISGFAELALLNVDSPQTVREDIRVIHSECNRAARVIYDLIRFSGECRIVPVPVGVEAILKQALKLKSNELDVYKINVTTRVPPDLPKISSDPDQLIEVLLNILDNAQQAMTEASGCGEIEITARPVEDRIRISIKDSGPGIAPDNLASIFQPFFATKAIGQGSGLGLSIAQSIMRQHGGDLWAESSPDAGSTFHLELPTDPVSPTGGDDVHAPDPEPAATNSTIRRILVVDDDLGYRQLLARALSSGGHAIDLAGDWVEAWNLMQTNSYDRVVLNLGLPAVNGVQLFERVQAYDSDLAARCVFITGYLLTPELEATLAATGVPYLTKPFAITEIRRLVLDAEGSGVFLEG